MSTPAIQQFCKLLWEWREESRLPEAMIIFRMLSVALAKDVDAHSNYDPSSDRRVSWALEIIRQRQSGERTMRLEAALEFVIGEQLADRPLICLTGKDYAAGEVRSA